MAIKYVLVPASALRDYKKKAKPKFTERQLEGQLKFKLMAGFLTSINGLVKLYFKDAKNERTGYSNAFSANRDCIEGSYPDLKIAYPKVMVTKGNLPGAASASVTAEEGVLHFSWTNNAGEGRASAKDKAILITYCPALDISIYRTGPALRGDLKGTLERGSFKGETWETWISFASEDDKQVSNSYYTGRIVL